MTILEDRVRLSDLSLLEAARAIRERELKPSELIAHTLEGVLAANEAINCYGLICDAYARKLSVAHDQLIEAGIWLGPLHGIPVGVKDCIDTAGLPTTGGSNVDRERVPEVDADAVARIRGGGGVVIGKTNLYEWGFGVPSSLWGDVKNPWDLSLTAGASSNGSAAAIAAGFALAALGTDSGGSVRIPAAFCGVFGFKPGYGRVSRKGVAPRWSTLDHVGIITRNASDAALVFRVLTEPTDPTRDVLSDERHSVSGMRVGVLEDNAVSPEVQDAQELAVNTFTVLGCQTSLISLPSFDDANAIMRVIFAVEMAYSYIDIIRKHSAEVHPEIRAHLIAATALAGIEYLRCQQVRSSLRQRTQAALESVEAVLLPVVPGPAWRSGLQTVEVGGRVLASGRVLTQWCALFNISGHPAASFLAGFTRTGLPISLQLVAKTEGVLFRLMKAFERETDYWRRLPASVDA